MSKFRASRTRLVSAAVSVVLAAFALTACDDGTGVDDEGASAAGSSVDSASPTEAPGSGSTDLVTPDSKQPGAADSGATKAPAAQAPIAQAPATKAPATKAPAASSGKPVTCEGSNTRTVAAPLTRPVNHMLLTVTNTSARTCFLYGYPAVAFGEAQSVPPVIEDSQSQAVVTLEPGDSGYASVNLSATDGSGSNGLTAKSLTVYFQGRAGNGSVGSGAHPSLPANGIYIDDSLKVTYWQQSMDDAVNW